MNLVSLNYIVLFIGTVFVYYILPTRVRWIWLLLCSIAFYTISGGYRTLLFLLSSIVTTYLGVHAIQKLSSIRKKRTALFVVIGLMLGQLIMIKGTDMLTGIVSLFNPASSFSIMKIAVPIGISYFTLTLIGYVVDVYREVSLPQKNILKYSLFTCYFPTLVSGPILRYNVMEKQLFLGKKLSLSIRNISFGLQRMLFGYFKKMVIADRLAIVVQTVYGDTDTYSGFFLVIATLCYAFQLYADFSGCIDIVMGTSEVLGIDLPENFQSPFYSQTISEFWRRWHITLGTWFKDYVLYPLLISRLFQSIGSFFKRKMGKKIGKKVTTSLGLMVIWLSLGVWHGGTLKWMIASGILPFVYITSSEFLHPVFVKIVDKFKINTGCTSFRIFQRIRTISLMCICWVFVCSSSLMDGAHVIKSIFLKCNPLTLISDELFNCGLNTKEILIVIISVAIVMFVDYMKYRGFAVRTILANQNIFFQYVVLWGFALTILLFGITGGSQFIYFQF